MLKLHFKDNRFAAFWVTEKLYSIGSARDNQLVIEDASIAPYHAKLILSEGKYLLKDNASPTGTFINGQRITHKQILPGDILRLGNIDVIVLDPRRTQESEQADTKNTAPWRLVSDSRWLPNKTFLIPATGSVILGRTKSCDITIPGTHIARQHTEFQVRGSQLFIKDLGSTSGTFLNEKSITLSEARSGDKLRLDVFTFHLVAPGTELSKTPLHASIDSISKPVERKQLSTEPKRWKTRPTSPGNRIEPSDEKPRTRLGIWLIFAGFVAVFVMIARKFLW